MPPFDRSPDRSRLISHERPGDVMQIQRLGTGFEEVRQRLGGAPRIGEAVDGGVKLVVPLAVPDPTATNDRATCSRQPQAWKSSPASSGSAKVSAFVAALRA